MLLSLSEPLKKDLLSFTSVQFSRSVMSDSFATPRIAARQASLSSLTSGINNFFYVFKTSAFGFKFFSVVQSSYLVLF